MSLTVGELTAFLSVDKTQWKRDLNSLSTDVKAPAAKAGTIGGEEAGKHFGSSMLSRARSFIGPLAALGAGAAVIGFGKDAFAEAQEAQKTGALTQAVIESTGGAANVTTGYINDLSTALSNKSGVDDELVQSGANVLLTFKNIKDQAGAGNDIFDQATQATLDLSSAMGKDMKSSALLVGKALNDPVGAIGALSRAGVQFTDQQKDQIKAMVDSGDTMGAQKIILGELKGEFGGAAEAMATPADKAKVSWKNFQESVGTAVMPMVNKLFLAFSKGLTILIKVGSFVARNKTAFEILGGVLGLVVAAVVAYNVALAISSAATKAWTVATNLAKVATAIWTGAQWLLNAALDANPIGLVVIAIAALVAGIIIAWKHSETFRDIVTGALDKVKDAAQAVADFFTVTIPKLWADVVQWTKDAWNGLIAWITGIPGMLVAAAGHLWQWVSDKAKLIKDAVVSAFVAFGDWVANLPTWAVEKGGALWDWIATKATGIKDAVVEAVSDFGDWLVALPGWIASKAGDVWGWLVTKATSAAYAAVKAIVDVIDDAFGGGGSGSSGGVGRFSRPGIPGHADGGIVRRAHLGIVGEAGPEAILPLDKYQRMLDRAWSAGASTGGSRGDDRLAQAIERLASAPTGGGGDGRYAHLEMNYTGPQLDESLIADHLSQRLGTAVRFSAAH